MTRQDADGGSKSPAAEFLELVARRMRAIERDMRALTAMGEAMAEPLLRGGNMYLEPVGRFWGSEFHCRAGGLMGLRYPAGERMKSRDVVYFEVPRARKRHRQDAGRLRRLARSRANLFAIGRAEDVQDVVPPERFAGFTGAAARELGMYRLGPFEPLVSVDLFERIARGWIAAGEMIAACTRAGRMPIVYMSNWFEGSRARNSRFLHCGEFFHVGWACEGTEIYVPPLAPGYAGGAYLAGLERIRSALVRQLDVLACAGRLLADVARKGRRISASAAGHCLPHALDLPKDADYPIHWLPPISSLRRSIPRAWRKGDASIHFGYGPTHTAEVERVLKRGIRLVQTSPYGRPADLRERSGHVWFDLPWRPGDAEVEVPGYSVRILPASAAAHAMAYGCLLAELAANMGWQ